MHSAEHAYQMVDYIMSNKCNNFKWYWCAPQLFWLLKSNSQGLSLKPVRFCLPGHSPLAVTPHYMAQLGELQFLRMKGNQTLKPNSTRVCLSAIVDIFICLMSMAETQWEIRTSQPKLTVKSQTVKRSAPTAYNTQMDCHIRFRGIGYYTLGLLFPTQPSAWQDLVWGLSCLVPLAFDYLDKDKKSQSWVMGWYMEG